MEKWPNFFIVGAEKAGTSSLYEYLRKIPGIYMSPDKEPGYFSRNEINRDLNEKQIPDKKNYLRLFENVTNEEIIGEASPGYLPSPDAARRIYEASPHAHILISLRDPTELVFSQYLMLLRQGRVKGSFKKTIERILKTGVDKNKPAELRLYAGLYAEDVERYLKTFGSEQVKIIIFEEWITDPKKTVEEILHFLGLSYNLHNFKKEVYNAYGISRGPIATQILRSRKLNVMANILLPHSAKKFLKEKFIVKKISKPEMTEEERQILINFYRDDVKKLQSLLGQKLPWHNFDL